MMPRSIARGANALPDELDAGPIAAAPDNLAVVTGARIAGESQPQCGGQSLCTLDHDLGTSRGNILHNALASREAAIERDPCQLPQLLAGLPLPDRCHLFPILSLHSYGWVAFRFG
jgi:hypothetical protein